MLNRYAHGNLVWVDLMNPTQQEVRGVMEECNVPPELLGDLTTPVPRSEVATAAGAVKLTLNFPIVKRTDMERPHEVKFIITKTCLITARYEDITAIHKFAKEFEVLSILSRTGKKAHAGHIFVALIETLYKGLEQKLDYMGARFKEIDEGIFNGKEKEMVGEISSLNRRFISFRLALSVHESTWNEINAPLQDLFGVAFAAYLAEARKHFQYLMHRVRALGDSLDELRDTNHALLTTNQNEVMKNLTVMAFITFPLMLFTSMFGMNTKTLPIAGKEGDFWIILGAMLIATAGFFVFFKYRNWI